MVMGSLYVFGFRLQWEELTYVHYMEVIIFLLVEGLASMLMSSD